MSSHQNNSPFNNIPENIFPLKNLNASRVGLGGINSMFEYNKAINAKMMKEKMATNDGSALGAQALINPRWSKYHADSNQTGIKTTEKATEAENEKGNPNKKNTSQMLTQPRQGTKHEGSASPTKTMPAQQSRRIICPLSKEEQTVKVENSFFDPKKHKGLRSSRWANE